MVSIILISHGKIASSTYEVAKIIMPDYVGNIFIIDDSESSTEFENRLTTALSYAANDEILVLTDLCGATPDNIVKRLLNKTNLAVVSGLSLPMLLKAFNYSDKPLKELVSLVSLGAKKSINICMSDYD